MTTQQPPSICPKCNQEAVTLQPPSESGKRRAECSACEYKFKLVPTPATPATPTDDELFAAAAAAGCM